MIGSVLDKYEVLQKIGEGGMATVYRGRHTTLGRDVAIKVLHPHLSRSERNRRRFAREARAIENLDHDSILRIFDYSGTEAEDCYIVTEFVDGATLQALVSEHGRVPSEVAAIIGARLAEALGYAHDLGIIHRDLKPENVILTPQGRRLLHRPVLIDFGIAKFAEHYQMSMITAAERVVGTAQYMSPEQAMGRPMDGRTDVYGLGVVMYELLSGVPPFQGAPLHVMRSHMVLPVPELSAKHSAFVSDGLRQIVRRCLAKRPGDRYADGAALAEALREVWEALCAGEAPVLAMALAPDPRGELLAVGFADGDVELRRLDSGERVARWRGHMGGPVLGVGWAREGDALVSLCGDGELAVWGRQGRNAQAMLRPFDAPVTAMASDPSGDLVALGSAEGKIRMLSLSDRHILAEMRSHRARINALCFDAEGRHVASAGEDGAVLVWDVDAPAVINRFGVESGDGAATAVAFHPSQDLLAFGDSDGMLAFGWLDGHRRPEVFVAHADEVSSVAFVPDADGVGGSDLVSTGLDGELRQWTVPHGHPRPCAGVHPGGVRAAAVSTRPGEAGVILALNDSLVMRWAEGLADLTRNAPDHVLSPRHPDGWLSSWSRGR